MRRSGAADTRDRVWPALRAQGADVVGLVLRESIAPVAAGFVIRVSGSLAAGKLVETCEKLSFRIGAALRFGFELYQR